MDFKYQITIKGVPKCQYCEHDSELEDEGWGVSKDIISGVVYYYHIECFVSQEDYIGGLYE